MKYKKVHFFEYHTEVDIEANSIEEALKISKPLQGMSPHKCVRELILAEDENGKWDVAKDIWYDNEE